MRVAELSSEGTMARLCREAGIPEDSELELVLKPDHQEDTYRAGLWCGDRFLGYLTRKSGKAL